MTHTAEDFRHKPVSGPIRLHVRTTTDSLFIQYCKNMQFSKRVNVWEGCGRSLVQPREQFYARYVCVCVPGYLLPPGHWSFGDGDNKYIASSATEAFMGIRQWMREHNLPARKKGQDLSVLDDVLFPEDEDEDANAPNHSSTPFVSKPISTTSTSHASSCNECIEVD